MKGILMTCNWKHMLLSPSLQIDMQETALLNFLEVSLYHQRSVIKAKAGSSSNTQDNNCNPGEH